MILDFTGELLVKAFKYERNIKIIHMCVEDNKGDIILNPEKKSGKVW